MSLDDSIEKLILGRKLNDFLKPIPTADQTLDRLSQQLLSKHPMRSIGLSETGALDLSEENRASHIHILGSTRQGKSKFLESLIRHDIDNGYGCTLLDPTENGATAYSVLRYCIKKKYTNVVWIDLNDPNVIPTINPLKWRG